MKNNLIKVLSVIIFLCLSALFIIKVALPNILKSYIDIGLGDCQKESILCLIPDQEITDPVIDRDYIAQLVPHKFSDMELCVPKGFTIVKEKITRVYYKKRKYLDKGATIYLLYEEPGFFPNLYPQLSKLGIKTNYDLIARAMHMTTAGIKDINDVFFAVMKTLFTANLGEENNIKISRLSVTGLKGFISYGLSAKCNFYDCNITDAQDHYFKVYIKDMGRSLDLDKVMAIISTVRHPEGA